MPDNNREWDWTVVGVGILAFLLPLTLLIPNFPLWTVIPKLTVTRFHILAQQLPWWHLNLALITISSLLFLLHLEIRKRKLDEMVESVMTVSYATEKTVQVETQKQEAAMRACVQLLEASAEQYEHLVLLRDELRQRKHGQRPPTIDDSDHDAYPSDEPRPLTATDAVDAQ